MKTKTKKSEDHKHVYQYLAEYGAEKRLQLELTCTVEKEGDDYMGSTQVAAMLPMAEGSSLPPQEALSLASVWITEGCLRYMELLAEDHKIMLDADQWANAVADTIHRFLSCHTPGQQA